MNQSFTPVRVGRYTLPNRLVMAPMTRSRAKLDGTPGELAAEYYAQRASVGLIVIRRHSAFGCWPGLPRDAGHLQPSAYRGVEEGDRGRA
jgi:2,4-dienoyl-CoA reductase-like NADH-dependent reductase (Old Yellow Enzyme family)